MPCPLHRIYRALLPQTSLASNSAKYKRKKHGASSSAGKGVAAGESSSNGKRPEDVSSSANLDPKGLKELAYLQSRYSWAPRLWRKRLIDLLTLDAETLGPILRRIHNNTDPDTILTEILATDAQFKELWGMKDDDITFRQVLAHSICRATSPMLKQGEGHSTHFRNRHMDLPVATVVSEDREPVFPVELRDLPWFGWEIEPKPLELYNPARARQENNKEMLTDWKLTWRDLFTDDLLRLPATDLVSHSIPTVRAARPVNAGQPLYTPEEQDWQREWLPRMIEAGILTQCEGPWAARIRDEGPRVQFKRYHMSLPVAVIVITNKLSLPTPLRDLPWFEVEVGPKDKNVEQYGDMQSIGKAINYDFNRSCRKFRHEGDTKTARGENGGHSVLETLGVMLSSEDAKRNSLDHYSIIAAHLFTGDVGQIVFYRFCG
ncbi:hypothetical protein Dda_3991 [Drechslerella dactyloides]|uniref:Uncharacterized protein n=1 Tax=Drechslerella dactyloides TaxID=74499 RepID=A0AAD6NKA1_DREDA|nr:hypothetical protein Dda_3991 [Drechslerella dactyloides]